VAIIFVLIYLTLTGFNLLQNFLKAPAKDKDWLKFIFPVATTALFALGVFLIVLTFFIGPNAMVKEAGETTISISVALLAVNVLLNRLFLDGAKSNIGREFIYSSITVSLIVFAYLFLLSFFGIEVTPRNLAFLSAFILLTLITHSTYDWVMSFVRNLFYSHEVSLPRANDEEVSVALRNLNRPERLESSSLMRLKLVAVGNPKPSLDKLRDLLKGSINYFEQDKPLRRSRSTLKYEILKLISEQVEEGQILWDLGFEEYPLGIAENGDGKKPRFAIASPTDYQAISRNAFIALKKEAIHDLAWRISYLEKHSK
jgi:hypothetical protein